MEVYHKAPFLGGSHSNPRQRDELLDENQRHDEEARLALKYQLKSEGFSAAS